MEQDPEAGAAELWVMRAGAGALVKGGCSPDTSALLSLLPLSCSDTQSEVDPVRPLFV